MVYSMNKLFLILWGWKPLAHWLIVSPWIWERVDGHLEGVYACVGSRHPDPCWRDVINLSAQAVYCRKYTVLTTCIVCGSWAPFICTIFVLPPKDKCESEQNKAAKCPSNNES